MGQNGGELRYPGTCRGLNIPLDQPETCLRVRLPDETYRIHDLLVGSIEQNPLRLFGDTVIRDRNGNWTYQFAVVVDDLDQKINLIIRGQDLLSSVGRQLALRKIMGVESEVKFLHHPLIQDRSGQKLSKLRKSPAIFKLRQQGLTPTEIFSMAEELQPSGFSFDP